MLFHGLLASVWTWAAKSLLQALYNWSGGRDSGLVEQAYSVGTDIALFVEAVAAYVQPPPSFCVSFLPRPFLFFVKIPYHVLYNTLDGLSLQLWHQHPSDESHELVFKADRLLLNTDRKVYQGV